MNEKKVWALGEIINLIFAGGLFSAFIWFGALTKTMDVYGAELAENKAEIRRVERDYIDYQRKVSDDLSWIKDRMRRNQ